MNSCRRDWVMVFQSWTDDCVFLLARISIPTRQTSNRRFQPLRNVWWRMELENRPRWKERRNSISFRGSSSIQHRRGQPKSRLPLLLSPSRSYVTSLLDRSTPPSQRTTSRGIWRMLRSSISMYARSRKRRIMLYSVLQSTLKRKTEVLRSPFSLTV